MSHHDGPPRISSDAFDGADGSDELRDFVQELKAQDLGDDALRRVAAALPMGIAGVGAGGAGAVLEGAAGAGSAATAVPVGVKVVGVLLVLGLMGGVGAWVMNDEPAAVPATPEEPVRVPEPENPLPPITPSATLVEPPDEESEESEDSHLSREERARRARRRAARAAARSAATMSSEAEAEVEADVQARLEEDRLLREARGALSSNARVAFALTEEHRQRFPRGMLVQEREVVAVDALRRLGRGDEAQRRAERLLTRWPNSAHRPRLEAMGYH